MTMSSSYGRQSPLRSPLVGLPISVALAAQLSCKRVSSSCAAARTTKPRAREPEGKE